MFGDDIQYEFSSTNIDNNIKFKQLNNHVLDVLKNNIQLSNERYMHFRVHFNEIHKTSFSNFVDTILNLCKWLCFSFSNHAAPPYRYTDIKWMMFVSAQYNTVNEDYTVKLHDNYDFKNTDIYAMVREFSAMYEMIFKTQITKKDILDFAKKHNLKRYVSTLLVKSFVISEMPKTFHIQYFDRETIN